MHGAVALAADVDALVLDPAFADSAVGELSEDTASRYAIECEWHPGSARAPLAAGVPWDVPDVDGEPLAWQTFCAHGRARQLAERVVERHSKAQRLDAANIGQAAVSVVRSPERWEDWGGQMEVLQYLKYLWRITVVYGEPLA